MLMKMQGTSIYFTAQCYILAPNRGLSKFFGISAKFWLGLQDDFDLEDGKNLKSEELETIKQLDFNAA